MDIILLGITVVSLVVAFVMSMAAWRLSRDEKKRSEARVTALSVAAAQPDMRPVTAPVEVRTEKPAAKKAPWSSPPSTSRSVTMAPVAALRTLASPVEMPLNEAPRVIEPIRSGEPSAPHASGFLGVAEIERDNGSRQKSLAIAAVVLFVVLSGGLAWMMSGPRGTTAVAMGPNSPLELISLSHQRQNQKLAISGLVRNPQSGKPLEHLSAVVFLFDRMGTFVTSSRANVDFLRLGAGDESPFVVTLDAPATVSRYRVSFRTDEGVVPHVDRRGASPAEESEELKVKSEE
jgi:flagellar basal body-associated protein FliL